MLRSADYLLPDEATSNLDATSTALVTEAMDRLMKDRTTVMIATAMRQPSAPTTSSSCATARSKPPAHRMSCARAMHTIKCSANHFDVSEGTMIRENVKLTDAQPGDICCGFELEKKQYVASKAATLYTMRHKKCGAELLYFDRDDENKTFCIGFKTLPEDDTGVFHILEHSVLNGSKRFPVKEPFVSLLQGSMQTFLNAMTYSDKTIFPVSSRSEQDLFNLMRVYLDGVFCPNIYEKPEIFMQEGWHYEFDGEQAQPYYNGVVFSEMKGAYADVERVIGEGTDRLLYPDTCYGFSSGGKPEHIPELSYAQFIAAHKRFYHPSNARIFLDGHMDAERVLAYIDAEYLSQYTYRAPDFDFTVQQPRTGEATVYYEAMPGEETLCHMSLSKLLCRYDDVETVYAAKILSDYLTGSNEAPLKRAFLERGLAQDVTLEISDGIYQPSAALIVRNTTRDAFDKVKTLAAEVARDMLAAGLDRAALSASLERFAFTNREITEPYGVELACRAFDSWLYGGDPLAYIDNAAVFDALREKIHAGYFERLLSDLLGSSGDLCTLYVLPSLTKGEDDARRESERLAAATAAWDADQRSEAYAAFRRMQQWQQSEDSAQALMSLPHLRLEDVPQTVAPVQTQPGEVNGVRTLYVSGDTNGIVYLNLYFDVSDLTDEELCMLNVLSTCFGELRTETCPADVLQNRVKALLGSLFLRVDCLQKQGDTERVHPYLLMSASMLEENAAEAVQLLRELLTQGCYDETDRIGETVMQNDYFMRQSLISNGHTFAVTKSLSAFSAGAALKETLEGETFVRWFAALAAGFAQNGAQVSAALAALTEKVFVTSRLFAGYSGTLDAGVLARLIAALPQGAPGATAAHKRYDAAACAVEIPADVGFCALGHNLYALGSSYSGACPVLSSLVSYGYLWNMVRVQGGAYGTGMNVRRSGDIFCYSYRDPNLDNTRAVFSNVADFIEDFAAQGMPLDDIIIGAVNTTDPLLDPADVCESQCVRALKGVTPEELAKTRHELLATKPADLAAMADVLRKYAREGKFCTFSGTNGGA